MKSPATTRWTSPSFRAYSKIGPLLGLCLFSMPAWAADPIWTDQFDPGFGNSSASHVAVNGANAYVAGAGPFEFSPSSNADIRVRAYDLASGNLLWEKLWDASGMFLDDDISGIAARSGRVFVAGASGTNGSTTAFVVRAYEAAGGAVLWEDHCGNGGSAARTLAATANRVFVAGQCQNGSGGTGVVRAYSAADGIILWDARDIATPWAITAATGEVIAAGTDGSGMLVVHAYGAASGELLWQAASTMPSGLSLRAVNMIYGDGLVYLSWSGVDANSVTSNGLEAYHAENGRRRWQADPGDRINGLALMRDRLFAAEAGNTVLAAAYAARKGTLLWQDQPGSSPVQYSALAAAAGGREFLLAGNHYEPANEPAQNFLVRAYDARGHLLWEDDAATTAPLGASAESIGWNRDVTVASGWSGRTTPPFGTTGWLVRAYSTANSHRAQLEPGPAPSPE